MAVASGSCTQHSDPIPLWGQCAKIGPIKPDMRYPY